MFSRGFQIHIVLLMMLAFVSQSIASELATTQLIEHHDVTNSMSLSHHADADSTNTMNKQDCCKTSESCFMSSCFSTLLFPELAIIANETAFIPASYFPEQYAFQALKSLYHPPILS